MSKRVKKDLESQILEEYNNRWFQIADKLCPHLAHVHSNAVTLEIVKAYPDLPWDWHILSRNPLVARSYQTVLDNPELPWDHRGLSWNPKAVTWELVVESQKTDLRYAWDWSGLTNNASVYSWERVVQNKDLPWDWTTISTKVDWETVSKNLDMPWNWYCLTINPKVGTVQTVLDNLNLPWYKNLLGSNPANMNSNDLRTFDFEFEYHEISKYIDDLEFVLENIDENWNWFQLSANPKIVSCPEILENPQISDYLVTEGLCKNPNIFTSYQDVVDNKDRVLDYYSLSQNPKVAGWDFFRDNIYQFLDWYLLGDYLYQEVVDFIKNN